MAVSNYRVFQIAVNYVRDSVVRDMFVADLVERLSCNCAGWCGTVKSEFLVGMLLRFKLWLRINFQLAGSPALGGAGVVAALHS